MKVIEVRNVHQALPLGLRHLHACGIPMSSRAGNVISAPTQVTTILQNPTERVIFWSERDAPHFFHFFEGLWMLAGRRDVKYVAHFVKRMLEYSDNGHVLQGAYGYRWRKYFGKDQLEFIIGLLKDDPWSRRAVLTMWDPRLDLQKTNTSKDHPCNTQCVFRVLYGRANEPNRLHMTVFNRSHDCIWGAYGANAVHFSMMHEYVASKLGLLVGDMVFNSVNFHAYVDVFNKTYVGGLTYNPSLRCPYRMEEVAPYPMVTVPETWDRDLLLFMEDPSTNGTEDPFFARVAKPLWFAHEAYKKKDIPAALEILEQCHATDWKRAARGWLERRA